MHISPCGQEGGTPDDSHFPMCHLINGKKYKTAHLKTVILSTVFDKCGPYTCTYYQSDHAPLFHLIKDLFLSFCSFNRG